MVLLKQFLLGMYIKTVTGFDDVITRIPVFASVDDRRKGILVLAAGSFLAVALAVFAAWSLARFVSLLPGTRFITAGLLLLLAIMISFDVVVTKPRKMTEEKIMRKHKADFGHLLKLFGIGLLAGIATVIDDTIAYTPLFLDGAARSVAAIVGITVIAVLEVILVVFFAEKIIKMPYKEELAVIGLITFAILVLAGVI